MSYTLYIIGFTMLVKYFSRDAMLGMPMPSCSQISNLLNIVLIAFICLSKLVFKLFFFFKKNYKHFLNGENRKSRIVLNL